MKRVAIIGGGVAGISSAVELIPHDLRITIFESDSFLGGRVAGGEGWDTGRHLVTTAHKEFLGLLETIGSKPTISLRPATIGTITRLRKPFWRLSIPLAGSVSPLAGLLGSTFLSFPQRFGAVGNLAATLNATPAPISDEDMMGDGKNSNFVEVVGETFESFMDQNDWVRLLRSRFGYPLVRSICNLDAEQAAVEPVLRAIKLILDDPVKLAGWTTGNVGKLVSEPAERYLDGKIDLKLNTSVLSIERDNSSWKVEANGRVDEFDLILLTIPPGNISTLSSSNNHFNYFKSVAEGISAKKIITTRASWKGFESLPGPILEPESPYVVWFAESGVDGNVVVDQVFSGVENGDMNSPAQLRKAYDQRVKKLFGHAERVSDIIVRPYASATPSIAPGVQRPRVRQGEGLYYAGDWLHTGLPPTLESAAIAGNMAAKAILEDCKN
ncbi:FAD-dependent oxidoreductase [bacterium]|nr:FAD-dependent oxidoreductase [bacterium]